MARVVARKAFVPEHYLARGLMLLGPLLLLLMVSSLKAGAVTPTVLLPVPRATIAQGETITMASLEQRKFRANKIDRFSVVPNVHDILGKQAVRRLPMGMPIQRSAIKRPEAVKRGEPAQLVFHDRGLEIIAHVEPLEDGFVGETIRVRNVDTGLIVVGRVEENGTISIGP